ncbi:YqgE/AlgH family protein [Alphaproteobacteria bacterium]|jgi:putative transcriptional regulator|nr:YqgE/AlgH family protein [Alphaproteobacteria bacterium]MBT5799222.1 YqgE/AlgH family protein [Alphaproteobacteria bacterium]MDA9190696.1 YqgE/AlgH family protein [Alphaproteobacteria bacterium]MDC0394866.1 YqgE/AlgH family protein [Alphaproteobacteria bacterium]MDC3311895.1 YqgE/AlgH family protein [Alphaproteobacteria bacterium]
MKQEKASLIFTELVGHFLVATPQMKDPQFHQSVIFMCKHDKQTAMGLIINKPKQDFTFSKLTKKLSFIKPRFEQNRIIYTGGPVENRRGYILHSEDHLMPDSVKITDELALSMQVDMLSEIANGVGPLQFKIMLGYTGWAAGQLEEELRQNMWIHVPSLPQMIFTDDISSMWENALGYCGFNASNLSPQSGWA